MTVHYLYRAFDADGELLYVGMTTDWPERLRHHRRSHALWCPLLALFDVDIMVGVTDERTAHAIELETIALEDPWYNVIGQPPWRTPRPIPRSVYELELRACQDYLRRGSHGDRL